MRIRTNLVSLLIVAGLCILGSFASFAFAGGGSGAAGGGGGGNTVTCHSGTMTVGGSGSTSGGSGGFSGSCTS
jgi:hypothetical protein